MRVIVAGLLTLALTCAGYDARAMESEDPANPIVRLCTALNEPAADAIGCVIGTAMLGPFVGAPLLVGVMWTYACEASGHEFIEDPPGSAYWRCTGVPRQPDG